MAACQAQDPPATIASDSASSSSSTADKEALREEIYQRARKRNGGREPTKIELLNELAAKGAEEVGAIKDYGKPRRVAGGAKPEIVIKEGDIQIDGKAVAFGANLSEWTRALPKNRRCLSKKNDLTLCLWDDIGIAVGTSLRHPTLVKFIAIYLNAEERPPWDPRLPDGSTMPAPPDYRPKGLFHGYLELDGFGIDAKTKFWEIRTAANPERNLRCNPRDCSHPHGRFNDKANLYLRLTKATEDGELYELSISASEDTLLPASPPRK